MKYFLARRQFDDLKIIGLAMERSHPIEGSLVRVHFRLSAPPPLGWPYIFATVWRALQYPQKRPAGVEADTIWIDCNLDEVETCHLQNLNQAVAQANIEYKVKAQEQALNAGRRAQLESQQRSQLAELNKTLYPAHAANTSSRPKPRFWTTTFIGKIGSLFSHGKRQEH